MKTILIVAALFLCGCMDESNTTVTVKIYRDAETKGWNIHVESKFPKDIPLPDAVKHIEETLDLQLKQVSAEKSPAGK